CQSAARLHRPTTERRTRRCLRPRLRRDPDRRRPEYPGLHAAEAVVTTARSRAAMSPRVLAAALAYAGHGLAVFPVPPDSKKSYKSAEYSDGAKWGATRDAAEIRRDFARWPTANIGAPTGATNRIVVVDTDTVEGHGVDGAASLARLEAAHGPLPYTLMAISPTLGPHRYFQHPGAGIKIKSTSSEIGAGVDVKAD